MPGSELLSEIMFHLPLKDALAKNHDLLKYALDNSNGMPIDPQYADITSTEPEILAEHINKSHELGASTICLGDSFGRFYPQTTAFFLH